MKSKTVKLIFTALAFCLLISILAMGAFASSGGPAETPTDSDTSTSPEPEKVTVTYSITGSEHTSNVVVKVNNETITPSSGSFEAPVNSSVSITVTPEDGYKVSITPGSGWYVNGNMVYTTSVTKNMGSPSFKLLSTTPHSINATVSYASTIAQADQYGAYITTNPSNYACEGDTVTITVSLSGGQKVSGISGSANDQNFTLEELSSSNSSYKYYTFIMPDSEVNINAVIDKTTYYVRVADTNHGDVDIYVANGKNTEALEYNDWVELRINPANGYYIKSVKANGNSINITGNTYSFRVTENVTFTVEFTSSLYVNRIYSSWYGSVTTYNRNWQGQSDFVYGDTVYVDVSPKDGYTVKEITVTDDVTGNTVGVSQSTTDKDIYYFTMPAHPVTLKVEFQEGYAIKVADTKYGKVKVSAENADEDDVITITTEPDKGYAVSKISIKTDGGETVTYRTSIATKNSYYFYMPDDNVTITVTFGVAHKDMPFTDVHSYSWYYDAVQFVYDNDIMNGVSDTSFNPDGTVTRGMIVTMLWRMAGEPYSFGGGFSDVPAGHYCYSAAAWASRNGIVNGMTSTTFAPDTNITREQLVTILYRYAQYLGYSTTGSSLYGFTDASSVSSYATNAMSWAVKYGIISGVTTTTLVPAGTATRAQAAQMFMSFYDFLD